ncbi:MAG: flagellar export chaperone FlgN, partial [Gammaproteobacteria bacterium]
MSGTTNAAPAPYRLRALLSEFDAVLAAEYEALRERDSERLDDLVEAKHRLTDELEHFAPAVRELRTQNQEHDDWRLVRDLLARCALANRTNGAAIDASRCFVTSMLDLLTGRHPGERTYT